MHNNPFSLSLNYDNGPRNFPLEKYARHHVRPRKIPRASLFRRGHFRESGFPGQLQIGRGTARCRYALFLGSRASSLRVSMNERMEVSIEGSSWRDSIACRRESRRFLPVNRDERLSSCLFNQDSPPSVTTRCPSATPAAYHPRFHLSVLGARGSSNFHGDHSDFLNAASRSPITRSRASNDRLMTRANCFAARHYVREAFGVSKVTLRARGSE